MALRAVSTSGLAALAVAVVAVPVWSAPSASPPTALRLPADRTLTDSTDSPGPVVFRHSTHFALARNRCLECHPAPFKMLKRAFRGKHSEMDSGQTCGQCHNGKLAFGTADQNACASCHGAQMPVDPMAKDIAMPRSADSPGPVSFVHRTHVSAAGKCSTCHPKPFAMAATRQARSAGAMHAKAACGHCHDGKTAFSVEERCEGCHREETGR